jgi:pilus assembly protein Flp/PilA
MFAILEKVLGDDQGVTAIEYALIASLVAVGIIAGVTSIGTTLSNTFQSVASNL